LVALVGLSGFVTAKPLREMAGADVVFLKVTAALKRAKVLLPAGAWS
jgi:hypothetical protein